MYNSEVLAYLQDLEQLSIFFKDKETSLGLIKTSIYGNTSGYEDLNSLVENFKRMNVSVKFIFSSAIKNDISKYDLDSYLALRNDVFKMAEEISDKISNYQNLVTFTKKNSLFFKGEYISYN